jgi:hypothetical protein
VHIFDGGQRHGPETGLGRRGFVEVLQEALLVRFWPSISVGSAAGRQVYPGVTTMVLASLAQQVCVSHWR